MYNIVSCIHSTTYLAPNIMYIYITTVVAFTCMVIIDYGCLSICLAVMKGQRKLFDPKTH